MNWSLNEFYSNNLCFLNGTMTFWGWETDERIACQNYHFYLLLLLQCSRVWPSPAVPSAGAYFKSNLSKFQNASQSICTNELSCGLCRVAATVPWESHRITYIYQLVRSGGFFLFAECSSIEFIYILLSFWPICILLPTTGWQKENLPFDIDYMFLYCYFYSVLGCSEQKCLISFKGYR